MSTRAWKVIAVAALALYGAAELLAVGVAFTALGELPIAVAAALLVAGAVLLVAAVLVLRDSRHAPAVAVVGLVLAFGIALYDERVLGMGRPIHHVLRGVFTLFVLWATVRAVRAGRHEPGPDV